MSSNPKNDGSATATIELELPVEHHLATSDKTNGEIASDDLNRTATIRLNMLDGTLDTQPSWDATTSLTAEEAALTTDTSPQALSTGMPDNGQAATHRSALDLINKMLKDRLVIKGKRKALKKAVLEMAANIAEFLLVTKANKHQLRTLLESAGVKWPDNNSKFPSARVLVEIMLFDGEDPAEVQNRISEWAKVLTICSKLGHVTEAAVAQFLDENGGLKGVCVKFDHNGVLREAPDKDAERATLVAKVKSTLSRLSVRASASVSKGAVPDTSIFPDVPGHYLGFSMLMVRLGADGTLEIMGNVTPDFETFAKVIQRC